MIKYCPRSGCTNKIEWKITESKLTGFCPKHGHICGSIIWKPLTYIEIVLLKIRGYKIKE